MQKIKKISLLLVVFTLALTRISFASHEDGQEEKYNTGATIMHHISDSHEWHFATIKEEDHDHHITIPLPVILYSSEKGLVFFMASEFKDATGHMNLQEGVYGDYEIHHDKIHFKNNKEAHVYDISITKNVTSLLISAVFLLWIFLSIARSYKKNGMIAPKGKQSFFEPIIIFIRDEVAINFIGEKKYRTYLPYLLTAFFFIWFNNLLGLIPGGANVTGNIAITMSLAFITFVVTTVSGNGHYWKHILWTPGVPLPLRVIILPIEIVGIFTKPFSLMVRLFANITAGHIVILAFISLIFIFKSLAMSPVTMVFGIFMMIMELFVAILQAYIFTMLTAIYIGSAVEDHGHGHEEHAEHAH